MHELSLCGSIYEIVDRAAEGRPVRVIHLQVGKLRQVVPDTLSYCWTLVSDETDLAGSDLGNSHTLGNRRWRPRHRHPRRGEVTMCLGIPGQVVAMVDGYGDQLALVDVEGASRRVNIGLLDEGSLGPGDWVLIHMGFALEQVSEAKAAQAREGLELMGRGVDQS